MTTNKIINEAYQSMYESGLSRVYKHAQKHSIGTITAFRAKTECNLGEIIPKKENRRRNAILRAKLFKAGYGVTSIDGAWINDYKGGNRVPSKEESFLVVDLKDKGTLKADLIKFGIMFEQDSIVYSEAGSDKFILISSNTCENGEPGGGKIGVEVKLGKFKGGKDGEIFSTVNGRPFLFEDAHLMERFGSAHARSIIAFDKMEIPFSTCKLCEGKQ